MKNSHSALDVGEARAVRLDLDVVAAGLCCAVGQRLDAASPALLANLDHFQESEFQTNAGDPVRVARLPGEKSWGVGRVAKWLAVAVQDALHAVPPAHRAGFDPAECALLLLCGDVDDAPGTWGAELFTRFGELTGLRFNSQSAVLPSGRAGFAALCSRAQRLLEEKDGPRHVLMAGASSLLNARRINQLLHDERLQVPGNPDGFFPGEAAAAVLVARGQGGPLGLRGVGAAQEAGNWDGAVPNRAEGLTAAVRAACDAANVRVADLAMRVSDINGEAFYAREAALAFSRLLNGGRQLVHITPASGLGEVGAALGPAAIAYLWHRASRASRPREWPVSTSSYPVMHMADDRGLRAALILEMRPLWANAD